VVLWYVSCGVCRVLYIGLVCVLCCIPHGMSCGGWCVCGGMRCDVCVLCSVRCVSCVGVCDACVVACYVVCVWGVYGVCYDVRVTCDM